MQFKNFKSFLALLFIGLWTALPNVQGQETYNIHTLRYFSQCLEDLIQGNYDSAIINSSNVISRDPGSSVAYTVRARAYFEKGNMANAITDCTQAIRNDKNNISAYIIRGNAYEKNGEFNKALADWEAALRINPDNNEVKQKIEVAKQ